jgi:hypothetical protein
MPITKDAFLGIHPACHCGYDEAGGLSGHGGLGNVRRFEAEIDLRKFDGVHWEAVGESLAPPTI